MKVTNTKISTDNPVYPYLIPFDQILKFIDIYPDLRLRLVFEMSSHPRLQPYSYTDPNQHLCSTTPLRNFKLVDINPNLNLTPTPSDACVQLLFEKYQIR